MRYKALIVDVDGTLAKSKEKTLPSKKVRKAILKAKDLIHIGIATGRPLFLIEDIVKHLDLSGPSIINDGAMVIDLNTRAILYEKLIPENELFEAIRILQEYRIPFSIHDENKDIFYTDSYHMNKPVNIFTDGVELDRAHNAYEELNKIPTLHVNKYVSWHNGLTGVLVSHSEATKQHGILEAARALGISTEEIIGVGDGYNDFPLLMACGFKVAMGNAVDDLKEIADYIAPSVDEDGVADVIEKFILS
ncbi:MAG: HAD family phosphatase [Candidatus Levybacteria bacterium]|nr:HAD family phosphatase [Candidatus Levybacteria bacterium]